MVGKKDNDKEKEEIVLRICNLWEPLTDEHRRAEGAGLRPEGNDFEVRLGHQAGGGQVERPQHVLRHPPEGRAGKQGRRLTPREGHRRLDEEVRSS